MDSGEIVVSSIRAGMKREFAMMMKAQSEIGALPAGRRRMTRSQSTAGSSKGNVRSADKRREAEKVGAELREDMQRVRGTDGDSIQEAERPVGETTDLGMKMSEKVELNRIPTELKDLLQTGLLEGRSRPESELRGVIQGAGILCSCDECKERKVVTPNQFEMHAGSGKKRPPQYIFLDNGNSLRDVLNACKDNLSESLESVILKAIGRSNYTTAFCINCKELIPEAGAGRSMLLCDACVLQKESDASDAQIGDASRRSPLAGPSAPASTSRPPVVSESAQISSHSQPQAKRQGKLTRKDLRMHKSVLAEDVLPEGTALSYVMRGEKKLEGYKKDGGIFCPCCKQVVSPSQFEAHAGYASRRKPYMSIYTSNGVSLHQLSLELSKIRRSSTEEHDDLCSICEDGGDLLCCANCPRGFHTECVGLSAIPQGIWYCKYCQNMFEKEKFAEPDANAIAAGRVPGDDPLEAITLRCIRVVGTLEPEIGDVPFAGAMISARKDFLPARLLYCEKEYHVGCLKEHNIDDLKELPEADWFCCTPCKNINSALQKLIGDGEQRLPEALSDVVKMKSEGQDLHKNPELVIRWRLLHGKKATEDCRVWLSGAVNIFHDRFDPISDSSTGRLDLIPHMVYGRRFKDQDFCGMYCAVLMVGSVVVSAAIFRIFGEEVAELPLVATRRVSGKASLNVKDLVLPAADEAESLWRNRFGFQTLGQEQVAQCLPSTLCAFYCCN
ncbi:UNVERIFIED_CONTAM: Increased DNA methylation 1 [Sesamum calycinum]|uniref:Increased DNA methylation 1 n=1 Tax=Sesamum calycinum TaxID=2727403 RepID=A0AAW2SFZ8_9LAMI